MSSRKSTMLRFMLAAIALLGIGAAVTAAAWEDRVYLEVEADGATFNVQGRIATGAQMPTGDTGWDDAGDGWVESDDENNIQLDALFADLLPGDTRTFWIQLRNDPNSTHNATANGLGESWDGPGFAACDAGHMPTVMNTNPPAGNFDLAPGDTTDVFEMVLSVSPDWHTDCQGVSDRYVSFIQFTPVTP